MLVTFPVAFAQIPEGQTLFSFPANTIVHEMGPSTSLAYSNVPDHVKVGTGFQSDPNDPLSTPIAIIYDGTGGLHLRLLEWLNQNYITTHHYALVGEVSSEKVSPGSYLEMWSHFESKAPGYPQGAYFSRALADSGPMGKLDGTSAWRPFWLPFDATGTTSKLTGLELFSISRARAPFPSASSSWCSFPMLRRRLRSRPRRSRLAVVDPSQVIVAALPFASFIDLVPAPIPGSGCR